MGWEFYSNLFLTVRDHDVVSDDNYIYITGGVNHEQSIFRREIGGTNWELYYDFDDDTSRSFFDHSSIINDSDIYFLGGRSGGINKNVSIFNIDNKSFSNKNNMLRPRFRFSCEYYDGKIYVVGGESSSTSFVERYDISNDNWDEVDDLSFKIEECDSAKVGSTMWIITKDSGVFSFDMDSESFNGPFESTSDLSNPSVASINESIYTIDSNPQTDPVTKVKAVNNDGLVDKEFIDSKQVNGSRLISHPNEDSIFLIGGESEDDFSGDYIFSPVSPPIVEDFSLDYDQDNSELNIDVEVPDQNDITEIEFRYDSEGFLDSRLNGIFLDRNQGDISGTISSKTLSISQSNHYFIHVYTKTGAGQYSEKVENDKNVQSIALPSSPIIKNIREVVDDDLTYENRDTITLEFESDVRLDTNDTTVNFNKIDSTVEDVSVEEVSVSPNIYRVERIINADNDVKNGEYNIEINAVAVS